MKKSKAILLYVVMCLTPTIIMFATHDFMCKYDMNPLCYIECAFLAIIGLPLLIIGEP